MQNQNDRNTMVDNRPDPRTLSPEAVCRILYGVSIEALAAQIAENRDGRYDRFYES